MCIICLSKDNYIRFEAEPFKYTQTRIYTPRAEIQLNNFKVYIYTQIKKCIIRLLLLKFISSKQWILLKKLLYVAYFYVFLIFISFFFLFFISKTRDKKKAQDKTYYPFKIKSLNGKPPQWVCIMHIERRRCGMGDDKFFWHCTILSRKTGDEVTAQKASD